MALAPARGALLCRDQAAVVRASSSPPKGSHPPMYLASWNVNGIRAILKKGDLQKFIEDSSPDILCLQEVKAHPGQVSLELDGYLQHWNPARRPGYSGVATFSRIEPLAVTEGMGKEEYDQEGRVLTHEFQDFFLVNVYTPNSKSELERLEYRHKEWDPLFLKYCRKLEKKKPVIFCGDLNVAHREIDLARPKDNRHNAGFTDEEREGFDNIVKAGFVDSFREFNQEGGNYTWWSYRSRARDKNIGWRIDYFCLSPALRPRLKDARIHAEVMGSDHCPVGIELE